MADKHIGQGSQLVYKSQSSSWKVLSRRQASRIATISAWAVGSLLEVTSLQPRPTILLDLTTIAPKGPPLLRRIIWMESRIAPRMNFFVIERRAHLLGTVLSHGHHRKGVVVAAARC